MTSASDGTPPDTALQITTVHVTCSDGLRFGVFAARPFQVSNSEPRETRAAQADPTFGAGEDLLIDLQRLAPLKTSTDIASSSQPPMSKSSKSRAVSVNISGFLADKDHP